MNSEEMFINSISKEKHSNQLLLEVHNPVNNLLTGFDLSLIDQSHIMNPNLTAFEECFWTLPFLKQLKQEFEKSKHMFLCNSSPAFADLWMDEGAQNSIRKMGQDFLNSNVMIPNTVPDIRYDLQLHHRMLFDSTCIYDYKEIRLKFLDHEIKRLTEIMQKEVA